jgi:uncharacterized protein (DUF885 family)
VNQNETIPERKVGYVVSFERELADFNPAQRLEALIHAANALDDVAQMLELPALAEFSHMEAKMLRATLEEMVEFAQQPEFAELKRDLGQLSDQDLELKEWFDAEDGLRWVDEVQTYLERDPFPPTQLQGVSMEEVSADLFRLHYILERAYLDGVRFHLELAV